MWEVSFPFHLSSTVVSAILFFLHSLLYFIPTAQKGFIFTIFQLISQCWWSEADVYLTHVVLFLQQFEHASVTGTGSYVIDTLSCQQQRKMYDREAARRRGWKKSWGGDLLVE